MTISVTRRGSGPALIRQSAVHERRSDSHVFLWAILWVVLAILLALIVAGPAFAQAAPAAPVPEVGDAGNRALGQIGG